MTAPRTLPPPKAGAPTTPDAPLSPPKKSRRKSAAATLNEHLSTTERLRRRARQANAGGSYPFTISVKLTEDEYESLISLAEEWRQRPPQVARQALLDGLRRWRDFRTSVPPPNAAPREYRDAFAHANQNGDVPPPGLWAQSAPPEPEADDVLVEAREARKELVEAARAGAFGGFLPASPKSTLLQEQGEP